MNQKIGILIALAIFIIQLFLVHGAGMTWDEPASFFIGRANLQFWQTGDWTNLIDLANVKRFADSPMHFVSGEEFYPPFPFLVSSTVSYIVAERMHIISVIDAHHIGEILLGSIGVWAMYGLAVEVGLSMPVAIGTTVIYALYPTIFGQMRNDAKDIPLMSVLVVSVYFFLLTIKAWEKKRFPSAMGYGFLWAVALGLAEGSKPSAAIIAPILVVWLVTSLLISSSFRKRIKRKGQLFLLSFVFGSVAVMVFILSWPWLWDNPIQKLLVVWGFFKTNGFNMPVMYLGTLYRAGLNLPKIYPFGILLFQTPIELTVLVIIGTIGAMYTLIRKGNVYAWLAVVWFWLGIGRFLLPGLLIYAKVRHFIDAMPAFFLLAGFGVTWVAVLFERVHPKELRIKDYDLRIKHVVIAFLLGIIILHEAWISVQFYPYEPSYFNFLVGGAKNVAQKHLFDIEYWGSGTKEAMDYINSLGNAPVSVYSCLLRHVTTYYNAPNVTLLKGNPEMADYTIAPNSASWFMGPISFSENVQTRAFTVKRAGADLFYVYKNTSHFGWQCGYETVSTYDFLPHK